MTKRVLITGGAGFIGCNYAARLIKQGHDVVIFDNLSRKNTDNNLAWLRDQFGDSFAFIQGDIRDAEAVIDVTKDVDAIFHLAAQVAVTTSVVNPREDFEINALGSFNVLEGARLSGRQPLFLYASTNKVYGGMHDIRVHETDTRWDYTDLPHGLPETQPLDFHSPYGCSKGTGDQYSRDYFRIYNIPTIVVRQSCIYGKRQFGVEDQGWLAHFVIAAAKQKPLSIFGDGKQIRDMLWIDDLMDAYDIALANPSKVAGKIYNIGGGSKFTTSIWKEIEPILSELAGREISPTFGNWRPGDQKVYVSDIRKAERELGWSPKVSPVEGITTLWQWVRDNIELFD